MLGAAQFDRALVAAQRLLSRNTGDADLNNLCALALCGLKRFDQARFYAERAATGVPSPDHFETLAQSLAGLHRFDDSAAAFRRAIALDPHSHNLRMAFVRMLWEADDHEGVLAACRETLAAAPRFSEFATTLISVTQNLGDTAGAVAFARDWLSRNPDDGGVLQALVLVMNGWPEADPDEVFRIHQRLGGAIVRRIPPHEIASHRPSASPLTRPLRIGYLSSDLHAHSVTAFLEPILERHDRARFEVFLYATGSVSDETAARLRALGHHWRDAHRDTDAELTQRIRTDGVDILVELNGYTVGDRMAVMARRPAPVQATCIGYPNTTGLPGIRHRIVDQTTDPSGAEARCTESLVRLPGCFLCFRPPAFPDSPLATRDSRSPITFGSFNNSAKLSIAVAQLWSKLLGSVPGSRLVLKSTQFKPEQVRRRFIARFTEAGIPPDRLTILTPTTTQSDHLSAYRGIDIALDPFPYNGTATTCEALWMGVPVVTLRGATHAGRVGASLLTAAGLPDLIAESEDAYLRIVTGLASDRARLSSLRQTLRQRVLASRLCDAATHTAALETALSGMWEAWMSGRAFGSTEER